MSKLSHRQAFAEGVHASIAILRSGIAFPVFLKPAAHPHTKKNQLAEAFIHRLAGEVVVVRVPLLDSTLCPQEAGVPQPVLEYAHAATGLSRMKATVLWAHVQNSDASAGVSRDQLYRRAVTIANRFPGYELASAVKKLRIKQTIVDAKIQACVLRIGDLTRHEQTMDVHTSTHQSSDAADKYAQDVTRRGDGLFFLERRRRAARTGYHYSAGYGHEIRRKRRKRRRGGNRRPHHQGAARVQGRPGFQGLEGGYFSCDGCGWPQYADIINLLVHDCRDPDLIFLASGKGHTVTGTGRGCSQERWLDKCNGGLRQWALRDSQSPCGSQGQCQGNIAKRWPERHDGGSSRWPHGDD